MRLAAANALPTSRLPFAWGLAPARARARRYHPLSFSGGSVAHQLALAPLPPSSRPATDDTASGIVLEREMDLIISYNRFWWLTSNTNHVD
jgi:hypothetical protein